jgi:DNA polymerase-1
MPVVVSSDKDLMALVGPARMYDPMKRAWIAAADVEARFGVRPEQVSDLLTLAGDPIDGIRGVEGIGQKTAAKLLTQYGDLPGLVDHAAEVGGKRGLALRAAIADRSLEVSRQLAHMRADVELPLGLDAMVMPAPDLKTREFLFRHLEFFSLLPSDAMPTAEELTRARTPVYDADGRKT